MNNLLDTHALIWFINGDNTLSTKAKKEIELSGTINYVSIASLWEIAIKISIGKLELKTPAAEIQHQIVLNNFQLLTFGFKETLIISSLPFHHRDPFDRMLVAQALNNNLQIISKDKNFESYDIALIW